jgi:uncharacterized protein YfaS (alpha-2-macroglobulin family)
MKIKFILVHLLTLSIFLTTLPHSSFTLAAQRGKRLPDVKTEGGGLRFRLSEGAEPSASPTPSPNASTDNTPNIRPLDEATTQKLLARLPDINAGASDTANFKLRENSLPPPRTGQTIQAAFAVPTTDAPPAPAKTNAPLEVVRVAPEGEVKLAPALSITFSQPMVAVSSQEEAAANVPVRLTPQVEGKWRWLGAQTLMFQPAAEGGRLPMATNYTVTIPAGTKSALGNALPVARTFNFATPPPTLINSYPSGESVPRDPLMFMEFDQRVDAARILEHLELGGPFSPYLRLAHAEEIAADETVSELVKHAQQGRWIAFRAISRRRNLSPAFNTDTNIKIVVPIGTPSAEGPRTTMKEQSLSFKTYGAFRVVESQCGYEKRCSPFDSFSIQFNNQLDTESFKPSQVKITPEIPNAKITAAYNSINIEGAKRSNTLYTVMLDRAVTDNFKQTLASNNQVIFKVTTAEPNFFTTGEGFVVLDPSGARAFTIYSINYRKLKVSLYKVTPDDWQAFRSYQGARSNSDEAVRTPPGKLVLSKTFDVQSRPDEITESAIDLAPALTNGYGQVFVRVERVDGTGASLRVRRNREDDSVEAWVQATDIGLDAFTDKSTLVALASSLKDGSPLGGVKMSVMPDDVNGTTEANGLARLALNASGVKDEKKEARAGGEQAKDGLKQLALLVARRGDDVAILPQAYTPYYYSRAENVSWRNTDASESLRWYVFDDRKLYRPSEEVHVKGWLRKVNLTPTGDTEMFAAAGKSVNYVLNDSQGNEITKGVVKLNALAGFDLKLQLPPTMNLGGANLVFRINEDEEGYTHSFQVQEFRRPEFEITAEASEAPHFVGSFATATVTAAYYAGGGLGNTDVKWTVTSKPTNYTPPNRDDYTFGKFVQWWRIGNEESDESNVKTFDGRTDAAGKHTLRMDFDGVTPARPSSVVAEARVQDVNRQTLVGRTTLLVHPADVYVGLKSARTFVQKGEAFDIASIVTDLDGRALVGRDVSLRLVRLDYVFEKGEWKQKEVDEEVQTLKSGADAVSARFVPKEGGAYRLTARVRDERERVNESELSLWVAGGVKLPPVREVSQEKVELIPDRKSYAGGEVAEILVQSPFAPAEGVLTLRRSGLLRTERFRMNETSYTLRVPLEEAMTPNVHVQVDLVGAATRVDDEGNAQAKLPKRPAFAKGEINLPVPPRSRRLEVTAKPRVAVLEPGAETIVDVEVKDAQGRGVGGTDTAVVVVDESVLALTAYKLADPLSIFYAERDADVSDYHLREKVKLASTDDIKTLLHREGGDGVGGGGGGGRSSGILASPKPMQRMLRRSVGDLTLAEQLGLSSKADRTAMVDATESSIQTTVESQAQINLRQNFNALAVFAASLPTDASGRTQVKVKLPDNLTRYRVMAVSVAGGKLFGTGEAAITARKSLMARPSAPRFLNYGDRVQLPVVLQNQTDAAMSVDVAVRSTNAELTEGAGRRVLVPANDRVEVRFPIAAMRPGTARFQIAAASTDKADAAEVFLPVYTPATTEAFATYGVIDTGAIAQSVKAPADSVPTFGGLEITTASTQLQELTDAVIYLYNYPYECSEQISSRIISIAALKDVLTAFKTKDLPAPEAMRAKVESDIKTLQALQNEDGGFDLWRRGRESVPYVSVHVAHALVRAQSKGFTVPEELLKNSQNYLKDIENKIPKDYSIESKRAIQAYALYVRALVKDRDAKRARKLIADAGGVEKLSLESLGWLLPVLSSDAASTRETEAIRRHFNNRATETADAAHFADSYSDGAYTVLQSNRRTDGVILEALIGDQPGNPLIPKLVRGLLSNRKRGHWMNTQENVFILLALDRYFNTYEKTTPDFTARVWLGTSYAGEQTFRGRSVDRQQLNLPMSTLIERTQNAPANLTIGKEGAGRLYYRVGTKYAPSNLDLNAADYGFKVERTYEAIDNPSDVRRDPDGLWHIKAGARVRVHLTMSTPARRYYVALVDPLPAGLESLNPELATTETLPDESTESGINVSSRGIFDYYRYWRGTWYDHQNLRDERAEAFTSLLWEGAHEYSYFARATTPGTFIVPPAKAEEMYAPETFGRGHSDRVRVE